MITLKTLPQATAQEVFDQVATHLLTQNEKSGRLLKDSTNACMYRSPRGLKCAAGCLIGDDEYKRSFENQNWQYLVENNFAPSAHAYLINELQAAHDYVPVGEWRNRLTDIAFNHGLSAKVLNQ